MTTEEFQLRIASNAGSSNDVVSIIQANYVYSGLMILAILFVFCIVIEVGSDVLDAIYTWYQKRKNKYKEN